MFRKLASAILVAGALGSSQAGALGLGDLTLHSALNEPLNADIKLLSVGDLAPEQVLVKLGTPEEFERAGVDRDYFLTNIKFDVELDGKGNGTIHVRTHNLVNEPYLNFIIEARWPAGKLVREYTALLDLPVYTERPKAQVNLGSSTGRPSSASVAPPRAQAPAPTRSVASASSAPRAAAPESAPSTYSGGDSYEIRRSDTLWQIAQRVRPASDVSVPQTMVAIQQLNPDAFIRGNINLLREGAVLRLPSAEQAREVNTGTANNAVASQSRAWKQKAEGGAESADTLPVVRDAQPEASDRLTLSSAAGGAGEGSGSGGADATQLKGKLNQSLENLDRAERDNADLKSRVAQMQDQVDKLQRLVQLKDEQMAALQKQAATSGAAKPAPEAEVVPPPAQPSTKDTAPPPKAEVPAPAPAQPEQTAPATAPAEQTPAAQAPAATTEATPSAPSSRDAAPAQPPAPAAPAPKPAAPKPVAPPPPAQPDLLDTILSNPLYLGIGGGIIALLIAIALVSRQRAAQREADQAWATSTQDEQAFDQSFEEVEEQQEEIAESEVVAESVYDEEDTIEQAAPSTARSETGDAIGEADIYVAYGRYQHAIDLLKNAISSEPGRSDLRVKLLEVYLEAGDRDGFRSQFAALQALGDADATGRAKELLMSVDDGNAWIGDAGGSFESDSVIPAGLASSGNERLDSDTTMERPAITDDDLADLDLEDELDEADTSWTTTEEPDELPEVDTSAESASLDDLDLDLGTDEDLDIANNDDVLEPLDDEELALNEDDLSEESTLILADEEQGLGEALDLEDTDLELASDEFDAGGLGDNELGGAALEPLESLEPLEGLEDEELSLDADLEPETTDTGFSKNLDEIDAEIGAFDAESLQAAADQGLGEEEEFDFLSDSDEVATKLDLARAYIDMGDIDGARDILQEVLQEGEAQQKDEANKLLARIA